MKSLADYESDLRRRVLAVTLLGQLPYDEADLTALRAGLQPLFAAGVADGLRRVAARAELAFALYLVLEGTYHYTAVRPSPPTFCEKTWTAGPVLVACPPRGIMTLVRPQEADMAETTGGDIVHGNKVELSGDYRGATLNFWAGPAPTADAPRPAHIFLSYAWGDDRLFVERLRAGLIEAGYRVWRDVEDLPSRGNALRLELREALDAADRFVPICGPAAAASANVQLEWAYARDRCLPITPVLRLGDESALPPEFRRPLYFDFRADDQFDAQLDALVERLRAAPKRPGRLHGAFRLLPDGVIPRTQSAQLADLLRPGETARAITGRAAAGALVAAGGLGKSVVALMFMLDCDTRRAFPDGLFWLEFGQSPTVVALQAQVGKELGDDVAEYRDAATGKARLQGLLQGRKALLVLDDVWDAAHAEALLVHAPDCRWLITSRQTGLGHRLGLPPGHTLRVDRLSSDEGAALIAGRLGLDAGATHPDEAQHRTIVALLDGHAQAVALAAAHLVAQDDALYLGPDELLRRYEAAQASDNPFALLALSDDDRQQNLELSLRVSYDHLDEGRQRRFRALGAFAAEGAFSTAALAVVWDDADGDSAGDAARFLVGASLLERAEGGRWRQHALLRAYALALLRRAGEEEAARAAHFAHYAAEYGDNERNRPEASPGRHARIAADFDDIHHALEWGFASAPEAACDLLNALENSYLQFDQPFAVRRALLGAALAAANAASYDGGEANTLKALGDLEVREAQYGAARARYEAALGLFRAIPARLGEANTLQALGQLSQAEGDLDRAGKQFNAAAALYRGIGQGRDEAVMIALFAQLRLAQGQVDEAIALIHEALAYFEAHQLTQDARVTQGIIARLAAAVPDFDARWLALTGQRRPAWLGNEAARAEVERLVGLLVAWIQTPDWAASRDYLHAHAADLLSDAGAGVLGQLAAANPEHQGVADHVRLLVLCRERGIDAGYEAFLSRPTGAGE